MSYVVSRELNNMLFLSFHMAQYKEATVVFLTLGCKALFSRQPQISSACEILIVMLHARHSLSINGWRGRTGEICV